MLLEHVAINVPDAAAMADWYVENCQMKIVIQKDGAPFTRFLSDQKGVTCIEIYSNTSQHIPDYFSQHPLVYHTAFAVDDLDKTRDELIAAGATFFEEINVPNGTRLIMLRDPWGVPLQLCYRPNKWY